MATAASGNALADLRLSDLITFLILARTGSVTAAARELRVTPSQASKALARLEEHYHVKLLLRGPKGMSLTEAGREVLPRIAEAVNALAASSRVSATDGLSAELTLAAPSYLLGTIIAAIAGPTGLRLRGVELAPSQIRATATEGLFELAVLPGDIRGLPATWVTDDIGVLRKILVGPPGLAESLGSLPLDVDQVRSLPFIGALSTLAGRFGPVGDDCPLPVSERTIVHRVQTFGAALELAARGACVAFGPSIGARRMLRYGELVEIPVKGWNATEPLILLVNGDVVRERVRQQLVATLRRELAEPTAC